MSNDQTPGTPAGWYAVDNNLERSWDGAAWGDQTRPRSGGSTSVDTKPAKKKRRIFLWVFLAIQVVFVILIITGASSGSGQPSDCGTLDAKTCNDASDVGTAIGVTLIVVLWIVVDFLLALIYGVYRLAKRT